MEHGFFEQLLAIMSVSLIVTIALRRFGLPNIISYLLTGVAIGPSVLGWIPHPETFSFLAEFGVVFLLFSLGLEFSLPKLFSMRGAVFGLGSIQVGFCTLVFGGAVWLWGTSLPAAVVIAGALALSSTAIVTSELATKGQLHFRHGQLSIGVLLFQDLIAVLFLILVPVLAGNANTSLYSALAWALVKGIALLAGLLAAGLWLLPPLYKEVARTRSDEIFVLSTLVIVMLSAWTTELFGLSMALGGFIIGMMLGESPFRHQINNDIRGFKDILLGLFFVTIGMSIQIEVLLHYWPRIILFTFVLIAIKVLLVGIMVRLIGHSKKTAIQTGLNLAQAGEFGLALLALGVMHQLLPSDQASFIILVAVSSMALSPLLIRRSEALSRYVNRKKKPANAPDKAMPPLHLPLENHVLIGGLGRVGTTIARLLEEKGIDYIALDSNIDVVTRARAEDKNIVYGDSSRLHMLEACHIDTARMAILTFNSIADAKKTVERIRKAGYTLPIIVRSSEHGDFDELVSLGANYVIPEMLEASLVISSQMFALLDIPEDEIQQTLAAERKRVVSKRATTAKTD